MNKRPLFAFVALCVTGTAAAQTPPTPPAPRPVPAPQVIVPPVLIPPISIPPIVIPPIAPVMIDAQHALDMAQMSLQNIDLSHLRVELDDIQPALAALDAMPPMPPMPPMAPMPAMDFGMDGVDRAMAMADRAQAMADREIARETARAVRSSRSFASDASEPALASEPPAPAAQQDVGDSVYQAARTQLNRGNYDRAAQLFRSLRDRYSRSTYVGDSYYWEAYALYRQGGSADTYRQAIRALDDQKARYPRAATRGDSDQLKVRLQGELARMGDGTAIHAVDSISRAGGSSVPCSNRGDDEDDVRVTALNALMQMNSDDAMPVLKQVLAKRDACSAELRRKAVYVISNKRSDDAEALLLDAARNDPDHDVRMAAVSSLSNLQTERSANALDSIIRGSQDMDIQRQAIAALASHRSPKAGDLLRGYVSQGIGSEELREYAILYLASNRRSTQNSEFLRDQYKLSTSRRVKDAVVRALANAGGADNAQFLLSVAMNDQEQPETRRMALYQAAQSRMISFDSLTAMYDRTTNRDTKETLLSIYGQRRGGEGVDKLIDIVKTEKDRELRNRAVQYLGNSRDPRAAQFLAQLINQ